jgi:methionyl-tRNA formyltransferase
MNQLKIIFMGTPDFAVGILDTIIKNNYEVVGVITAADKPAGRGQKLKYSAVKEYALANNLNLLQPTNLKNSTFLEELESLQANLQVVVAFRMLPKVVWAMPALGTFNLHASLLPDYRGAAPINWAIINGDTQTGVTTFFIDDKIDTGNMLFKDVIEILPEENAGQLHDKLMKLGQQTVIKTLQSIENGSVKTIPQDQSEEFKTAYKLNKENCEINWKNTSLAIVNQIRGLSPYPAAWTTINDLDKKHNVKIYESKYINEVHQYQIGQIITTKKEIKVAVDDGFIQLINLQLAGKKRMDANELLNGITFSSNAKID